MINAYKQAFNSLPLNTVKLFFGLAIIFMGLAFKNFYSLILSDLFSIDMKSIGLVLSISGVGSLTGTMISGFALKLTSPINAIRLSVLFCAMSSSILLFDREYYPAVIGIFVFSTFASGVRPALQTYLSDLGTDELKRTAYSLYRVFISVGSALGVFLCGVLADISYTYTLWLIVVSLVLSLVYCSVLDFNISKANNQEQEIKIKETDTKKWVLLNYETTLVITSVFLFSFAMFQVYSFLPIYLVDILGMSKSLFGSLSFLNLAIVLLFQMQITKSLSDKSNEFGMVLGGVMMFSAFGILLLGASSIYSVIVHYSLWSVSICIFYPSALTKLSALAAKYNKNSSSLMVSHQFTIDMTLIVGPLVSGFIAAQADIVGLWYVCGFFCSLSILLSYRLAKMNEEEKENTIEEPL